MCCPRVLADTRSGFYGEFLSGSKLRDTKGGIDNKPTEGVEQADFGR